MKNITNRWLGLWRNFGLRARAENRLWDSGLNNYSMRGKIDRSLLSIPYAGFGTYKNQGKLLKTYQRIKQKQASTPPSTSVTQSQSSSTSPSPSQPLPPKLSCQGCSVTLQSKDPTKYGYIEQKILNEALEQNIQQISKKYGDKVVSRDSKILDFMHEVEKQSGIKIFNQKTNQIENLDNVEVLMRLEEKIDKFEDSEQLLHRSKTHRKQILCFRCFSLKHHNRLPQPYDTNQAFTVDTTEFILAKTLNRHKESPVPTEYLFLIDAFDILGTFQEWLFKRLITEKLMVTLVVNKIDVMNKEYLNQGAIREVLKERVRVYLRGIYREGEELENKLGKIPVFFVSCVSRDGIKKLKEHIEGNRNNLQLVGYPNTGKTTLLNILARLNKSTSKVPGTTIKISEHEYSSSRRKIYDMPGLFSQNLLYNLIQKPSQKALLTWHKKIAPGLLTNHAFIYGGKIEIPDTRIIIFGLGGACQSTNRWFIDNCKEFWKGLPPLSELQIKRYEVQVEFFNGRAKDLEIAGYGFVGFRLCIPNVKKTTRKLTLYLPEKVKFGFRDTILSVNDGIFHNKSALTKKYMLERLTLKKEQKKDKKKVKKSKKVQNGGQQIIEQVEEPEQDAVQNVEQPTPSPENVQPAPK